MALKVVVKVIDLKTNGEEISRCISLHKPADRDWLSRVTTWAVNHGKGVQMFNVKDENLTHG